MAKTSEWKSGIDKLEIKDQKIVLNSNDLKIIQRVITQIKKDLGWKPTVIKAWVPF